MNRWLPWALAVLSVIFLGTLDARAVTPDEVLADPVLEQRARDISGALRCLVCQNQSIDESDADLAKDLRLLVRQRLVDGDSDRQVYDYVVSRYGEFVLLKPRLSIRTVALWFLPVIVLLCGVALIVHSRRSRQIAVEPLSSTERAELEKLLDPHN